MSVIQTSVGVCPGSEEMTYSGGNKGEFNKGTIQRLLVELKETSKQ